MSSESKSNQFAVTSTSVDDPMVSFSHKPPGFWLLQSVPSPEDPCYISETGDDKWYRRIINEYFRETIKDESTSLDDIAYESIETANELLQSKASDPKDIEPEHLPSAMFAGIRSTTDTVEYFTLGDTVLYLEFTSELDIQRICARDGSLYKHDFDPENQWDMCVLPESVDYARTGSLPRSDIKSASILTSRVDRYLQNETHRSPHIYLFENDVEEILRSLEETQIEPQRQGEELDAVATLTFN